MKEFRKKTPFEKLTWIRNLLLDNPEEIYLEAEGEEEVPEFGGNLDELEMDEASQRDLLRLMVRALRVNPYSYSYTINKLPSTANEDNYEEIIDSIESSLF